MTETLIAEWQKNSRETLQVRLDEFQGHGVVDFRAWYADAAGNKKPRRAGLTISVRHSPQTAKALCDALNAAKPQGMLESGDA